MKSKSFLFLPLIVSTLLIVSCKNCPSDENLGEVDLSDITLSFIPYNVGETTLTFENTNGQEISLVSEKGKVIKKEEVVVEKPCSYDLSDETNISMTVEKQEILFENDSIKLLLVAQFSGLNLIQTNEIDTNWVESAYCLVGNSFDNLENESFSIITNEREKDISQSEINCFTFSETLTLNEIQFMNVYSDNLGQFIFFNKEHGIIAFKYHDILYTLKIGK